jgi:hypothetical protein
MLHPEDGTRHHGTGGAARVQERLAGLDRVASAANLLGYLNFSDGRPDPRWQRQLDDAFAYLADKGAERPWEELHAWLASRLDRLHASGVPAFKDVAQARAVLDLALGGVLPAYRAHHADLLFHQTDRDLFQPFFLARVLEAVLAEGVDRNPDAAAHGALAVLGRLNDFVGHRPIAILETRPRGEPYDHERVRPIPLFLRGAGVAHGRYRAVVARALELLDNIDPAILVDAQFDLRLLDELALDPRAYDHAHPANKRPNYVFGEWDPHHLDNQGRFRRYVARQIALDALLDRVEHPAELDRAEVLFEAAAVFAGTLLMAAGVSGSGPGSYDSTTTLTTLTPRIARYRDAFYTDLLKKLTGPHAARLAAEVATTKQPFGAARHHFNRYLARHRALQLQQRHLALLYAGMGYPDAGREEADRIPTTSLRMLVTVQGHLATARLHSERGDPAGAVPLLGEVGDLIRRGIACGAFVDPWNILGFQGLFPLFAAREDTVRDARVDELIHLVETTLDVHARLLSEAAASGRDDLSGPLAARLQELAAWWDQFGTTNVSDVRPVLGGEAAASAEHVAAALARWHERGEATADLAFWRSHLEGFRSAKAFSLVVDALLRKRDYRAAMALLVNWLGQAEQVPLEDSEHSFAALAMRWMLGLTARGRGGPSGDDVWPLIQKFFDYVEANADEYWQVPTLGAGLPPTETEGKEEREDGGLYGAAYEDVTYKDSTADGTEGDVADDAPPAQPFDLEEEGQSLENRLRFLSTLSRLWQIAARHEAPAGAGDGHAAVLEAWLTAARHQQVKLLQLLDALHAFRVPEPVGTQESLIEYDRRRLVKEQLLYAAIGTCLDNTLAVGALQGGLAQLGRKQTNGGPGPVPEATWGPLAIRLEHALFAGDAEAAQAVLPGFMELFRDEPLLFRSLSDGGEPREILRVRVSQTILRALAANLPRLGLLRETYQLLRIAWASEQAHPTRGRGITEFNHLFQAAYQAAVECVVDSSAGWPAADDRDMQLAGLLEIVTAPFLTLWIEHSRTLQLSTLEAVRGDQHWQAIRSFVKDYGRDLFTTRFMTLANLRGILHRGVGPYLDYLRENPDPLHPVALIEALEHQQQTVHYDQAVVSLQFILQAIVENYEEFKDYNTTTTQSDYGENLDVLLDFLRLKAAYERHAWQFRPLVLAHEVLARAGRSVAAVQWAQAFTQLSRALADEHLAELGRLEKDHGLRLSTVADRLEERFVKPLWLDRLCALVGPSVAEARQEGGGHPTFHRLREELKPLAQTPTGVGLDVPHWLRRLELEAHRVQASQSAVAILAEELFRVPKRLLSRAELERQFQDRDKPPAAE